MDWVKEWWQLLLGAGGVSLLGLLKWLYTQHYKSSRDVLNDHDAIGTRWRDEAQQAWARAEQLNTRVDDLLTELRNERDAKHDALRYAKDMEALYDSSRMQLAEVREAERDTRQHLGGLEQRMHLIERALQAEGIGSIDELVEKVGADVA